MKIQYINYYYDDTPWSEMVPYIIIDKPLVVHRVLGNDVK